MTSVDVVLRCSGTGPWLRESAESVLDQASCTLRLLVIDDDAGSASAAIAAELASRDPRVSLVRHAANRGRVATYNEGIAWARADYLLFLPAEERLLPGALSRATRFLDAHDDVGLVHDSRMYDCIGRSTALIYRMDVWRVWSGGEFLVGTCAAALGKMNSPTTIVRTALQKRLGRYRTDLPDFGDLEMWMRFATCGAVARVDAPLATSCNRSRDGSRAETADTRDIRQRRAAFEAFVERFGGQIADGRGLRSQVYRDLGEQCFWSGVGRFCTGYRRLGRELLALAFELCPDLRFHPPLRRLVRRPRIDGKVREALGDGLWRAGAL